MRNLENSNKYSLADIEYFKQVIRIIDKQFLGDPEALFLDSSFLEIFHQDMNFVYHYHPSYWADFILNQHTNRENHERKSV